jgi:multidrug efflux pump subunit AcrB
MNMKSIIRFSMQNTVAVLLITALLIGGGLYAVSQMKMEKYPDIDIPYLHVNIIYPGASPEQSMRDVGEVLEKDFANIDGVVGVYSDLRPRRALNKNCCWTNRRISNVPSTACCARSH